MAEETGFEPARACAQHAFQACALNRSATPPHRAGRAEYSRSFFEMQASSTF